jgi:hypothetical protein
MSCRHETYLNCSHQRAYCTSPRWYTNIGEPWRMTLTRETEEIGGKRVLVPLLPPQISHGLSRARSQASTMTGRRLTAWAMARMDVANMYVRRCKLWTADSYSVGRSVGRNRIVRSPCVILRQPWSLHRMDFLFIAIGMYKQLNLGQAVSTTSFCKLLLRRQFCNAYWLIMKWIRRK